MKNKNFLVFTKVIAIVLVLGIMLVLQGCSSKNDSLPSKYTGEYKDSIQGGHIIVESEKAKIIQATLDEVEIDGVTREFVICESTSDFYFNYYSNKKFNAIASLNWYDSTASGVSYVELNGKFMTLKSLKYLEFHGFVYDYAGLPA